MIRKVYIKNAVLDVLISETLKFPDAETGGVFCGHYKGSDLIIEAASGPGPNAFHSITGFEIDEDHMYRFIHEQYELSDGEHIYVGEWHTHPETDPCPSPQDYRSVKERAYEWQYGELAYCIIGFIDFAAHKLKDQIITFQFDKSNKKLAALPMQVI